MKERLQIKTDAQEDLTKKKEFFKSSTAIKEFHRSNAAVSATLIPKMDRGFFIAQGDWTCYRRNYFQISVAFKFSDNMPSLSNIVLDGQEVVGFRTFLRAHAENNGKDIELIQHNPKRVKDLALPPPTFNLMPGGNPFQFDKAGGQLTATYERIQFKSATPNNGKRRAAQQYFNLSVELHAVLANQETVLVSTCESHNLVVRGRSPSHYPDDNAEDTENAVRANSGHVPQNSATYSPRPSNRYSPYARNPPRPSPSSATESPHEKGKLAELPLGAVGTYICREELNRMLRSVPNDPGKILLPTKGRPRPSARAHHILPRFSSISKDGTNYYGPREDPFSMQPPTLPPVYSSQANHPDELHFGIHRNRSPYEEVDRNPNPHDSMSTASSMHRDRASQRSFSIPSSPPVDHMDRAPPHLHVESINRDPHLVEYSSNAQARRYEGHRYSYEEPYRYGRASMHPMQANSPEARDANHSAEYRPNPQDRHAYNTAYGRGNPERPANSFPPPHHTRREW
jgi:hypothetical protein